MMLCNNLRISVATRKILFFLFMGLWCPLGLGWPSDCRCNLWQFPGSLLGFRLNGQWPPVIYFLYSNGRSSGGQPRSRNTSKSLLLWLSLISHWPLRVTWASHKVNVWGSTLNTLTGYSKNIWYYYGGIQNETSTSV